MTLPEGLYAITPDWADSPRLVAAVSAALQGGARIVQYRNKLADAALRHEQASALLALCHAAQVPLIINDHLDLALAINADGLHLGGDDGDLAAARAALGPHKLLGASCYNRIELAQAALAAGADHVGFGAAFVSGTKPQAVRAEADLYRRACATLDAPVVAIGGITVANGARLIDCGVKRLAVIGGLFDAEDVATQAARFTALF
ncbi:thiamine phosphate synthase [Chitinimonas sp. BJYL2]|uniref:thiamine phosphate synthase n=1 Tax=Chitinimonas sp. BJYL2 TaxID=2976696 RepID=UPI0022B376D0|nr:thiamine phosphate synthase [Chitinimonas sp. BJYL2]